MIQRKVSQHAEPGVVADAGGLTLRDTNDLFADSCTYLVERRGSRLWVRIAPGGVPAWPWGKSS